MTRLVGRLQRPTDFSLARGYAVQVKGCTTKGSYITVAVFKDFSEALDFFNAFPPIPLGVKRLIDERLEVITKVHHEPTFSLHHVGSTSWWVDQSKETVEKVLRKTPELPRFSIRNIARKSLRSFIK